MITENVNPLMAAKRAKRKIATEAEILLIPAEIPTTRPISTMNMPR